MEWLDRLRPESRFFHGGVGRRLLAVVVACALVPVATFALFAYERVRRELESGARDALHRASKTASMGVLERLLLADDALRHVAILAGPVGSGTRDLQGQTALLKGVERLSFTDPRVAGLSPHERTRLGQGATLLVLDGSADGYPQVLMLFAPEPGTVIATALEPDYLFGGLLAGEDSARVEDGSGQLLFDSSHDADDTGPEMLSAEWEVFLRPKFGAASWKVRIERSIETVHRPLREFEAVFPWIAGVALLSALSLSLHQIRRTLVPIIALTEGAERIRRHDYSARVEVTTRDEFGRLSETFNAMAETAGRHIQILATVNHVGAFLSAQDENDPVIDLVLEGSMEVTGARAGAFFLLEEERIQLVRFLVDGRAAGAAAEAALPRDPVERGLVRSSLSGVHRIASLGIAEQNQWRALDVHLEQPVAVYMTVPLRNEKRDYIGALLLLHSEAEAFSDEDLALAESLASQATIAIRKNQLVASFRGLFEGLIQLTVQAIDEKSPYTGDHCRNVPMLTELIADAVCADRSGPFKDFDLTPEQRYELRIAALLHDCGKVATPAHVMDKATKLETVIDRIELIATRFEVLRRDAMIRSLERRLGAEVETRDEQLAAELAGLDADLDFLRACNVGVERMPESSSDQVHEVAERHRWRDRSGLDHCGLERDEIQNLTIRRGTLNDAERALIQRHAMATIRMLEQLPFPPELRNVPSIAGAHHERMDGQGYPLQLRGEQLSVPARILGLADVFEALTARNRPYKPGKTLRQTVEILGAMSEEGHIDPQLLELLLRDRLHLRYAIEHMHPEQIDPEFQAEIEELTGV